MLQIDNTIISTDILQVKFFCDLAKCKGACCVHGDSGAPLEAEEVEILKNIFEKLKPYLRPESIKAIEQQGTSVIDSDGDTVTPLIDGKECAYVYFDKDIAKCSIEKAFNEGAVNFKKPVSCHLYPVRINKYAQFDGVNYHKWKICEPALENGERTNTFLFNFLKEPLTRKYGEEWYNQLTQASSLFKKRDH